MDGSPKVLTMLEVLQHLRQESNLHSLEKLVLEELEKEAPTALEDAELRAETLELLPELFESRVDACIFCDTLPIDVSQVQEHFGDRLSAEKAQYAANLARQLRGETVLEKFEFHS